MYAFDSKNKLFSKLRFGEKKSFLSSSSQPDDYFSGKILEVTEDFVTNFFTKQSVTYPSEKDILQCHSTFDGVWNGKVKFDDK